jgi:FkbM family methyltransferase
MFTQEEVDVLQSKAKSQLNQDMFVLSELGFKRDGYFVEFGATNGLDLSNTHLLETEMGWTGILAEPAKIWSEDLAKNRNCHIDYDCVWSKSGEVLEFNEVNAAELSTIDTFSSVDGHAATRTSGTKYPVNTISLLDLLKKYNAPQVIDYLSIDTEGSEFEILSAFDFDAYQFRVITCEHNYTPMRDKIYDLLTSKGYTRKFTNLSKFDDWYVRDVP